MTNKTDYLIVGAGLSGLYMAHRLEQMGKSYRLIEARDRIGGRILSSIIDNSDKALTPLDKVDMGPSWFWPQMHPRITQLIDDLLLPVFPQYSQGAYLLENQSDNAPTRYDSGFVQSPNSMRIAGGMQNLIDTIVNALPKNKIQLNSVVTHVHHQINNRSSVTIKCHNTEETMDAEHIIFALPLRLLANSISFTPSLPKEVEHHFSSTTTWMAAHAKFFAVYETPFWRNSGLSGSASSRVGPLVEIHDASTLDGTGALFGFIGVNSATREKAGSALIKQAAVAPLTRIFGEQASSPIDVKLIDWSQEKYTATQDDREAPKAHPHYGLSSAARKLQQLNWYFAGTEAAEDNGGYLEGALEAADSVLVQLNLN